MCKSCEVLYINGVKCHETGCPDAWHDDLRECKWCGGQFRPDDQYQRYCDNDCYRADCDY
jgi:hypothetical protein